MSGPRTKGASPVRTSSKSKAKPPGASNEPGLSGRQVGVQLGDATVRAMVLGGAARVFSEKGVRAASVEDILEASQISRRTFYRSYTSKEDVLAALYRLGTEGLLAACHLAVLEESDPVRRFERCMDAHLRSARELGRIIFVLGGEAHRQESPLHARRMEVQESIVNMLLPSAKTKDGAPIDPLLLRALVIGIEGVTRTLLGESDEGRNVTDEGIARARRVMLRMLSGTLAGEGERVSPLPLA